MRMEREKTHGSKNSCEEQVKINMQNRGTREENNFTLSMEDTHESSEETQEEQREMSAEHLTVYEEPVPIWIEEPLSEQEIEDKATLWVQTNVLKFSRMFGTAFKRCDKIAFDLFMKIDQKKGAIISKKGGEQ